MHRIHVWTIQEKEEQPSPVEIARENGADVQLSKLEFARPYLTRPVIVTYRCAHCPAQKVVRV